MLGWLAATGAYIGDVLLLKGDAAGFYAAGFFLQLVLTGAVPAPHSLDEAGLVRGDV